MLFCIVIICMSFAFIVTLLCVFLVIFWEAKLHVYKENPYHIWSWYLSVWPSQCVAHPELSLLHALWFFPGSFSEQTIWPEPCEGPLWVIIAFSQSLSLPETALLQAGGSRTSRPLALPYDGDILMASWPHGLSTSGPLYICTPGPLGLCTNVLLGLLTSRPQGLWTSGPQDLCTNVPLYLWTYLPPYRCTSGPICLCTSVSLDLKASGFLDLRTSGQICMGTCLPL